MRIFGTSLTRWLLEHFRYVLIAVAVVVLALGYTLIIGPEVRTVRQYGAVDLADETKNLEERENYLERLNSMLTKYSQLNTERLATLKTILPTDANFPDLFVILEDLATKSGLTLVSVAISPTVEVSGAEGGAAAPTAKLDPNVKTLDISVTVGNGQNYSQFKTLLTAIEDSLRIFNIQSLTFTLPNEAKPGEAVSGATWTLNLRTYYLVNSEASSS